MIVLSVSYLILEETHFASKFRGSIHSLIEQRDSQKKKIHVVSLNYDDQVQECIDQSYFQISYNKILSQSFNSLVLVYLLAQCCK